MGSIHGRALRSHPRVDLAGICGRTAPKTEALAKEFDVPAFLSVGEMLDRARPQVVSVCTGNKAHLQPTLESLEAGANVFVEKPMAFTLEEARSMVEGSRRTGMALGVNFNHRFSQPYKRALGWLRDGSIGVPAYLTMKFAGSLYKELNDPYAQLIETQGHSFDLLRLFGGEIEEVMSFLADPRGMNVYTSAVTALRFGNGAVGSLVGSWDSSYHHPHAQVFEMSGTEGRAVVDNVVDSVRLYRHDEQEYSEWKPGLFATGERDFWNTIDIHVHAFVDAVIRDEGPPVTGDDGLRALEITYAAIRSFESSRPVGIGRSMA